MATTITIRRGEGYGGRPYREGSVLRNPRAKEQILMVLKASQQYIREDGLSFGVGDEEGYIYTAECRPATPDEAAIVYAAEAETEAEAELIQRRAQIISEIKAAGERPGGENRPDGQRISDQQNIYGGGDWFIIGSKYIWYVQNNGADGDDWTQNNIITQGAGAVGWRLPRAGNEEIASACESISETP